MNAETVIVFFWDLRLYVHCSSRYHAPLIKIILILNDRRVLQKKLRASKPGYPDTERVKKLRAFDERLEIRGLSARDLFFLLGIC